MAESAGEHLETINDTAIQKNNIMVINRFASLEMNKNLYRDGLSDEPEQCGNAAEMVQLGLENSPYPIMTADNMSGRGKEVFIGDGPRYGLIRNRIVHESWTGVTFLCAEPGMGKTITILEALSAHEDMGFKTRYEDFCGYMPNETIQLLETLVDWSLEACADQQKSFLAIDHIVAGNEHETYEKACLIKKIAANNCSVLIGLRPESDVLAKEVVGAKVYWSCDLRCMRPTSAHEGAMYDHYAHGIPRLFDALGRMQDLNTDNAFSDPSYMEHYVGVLEESLRPELMNEERRIRLCMVLLGEGSFDELNTILDEADESLWRDAARDAPFFGIDIARGRFCCVGGSRMDALSAACRTLINVASAYPEIEFHVAQRLAQRDDTLRSALVCSICSVPEIRARLGLQWAASYIDVGAISIVQQALDYAKAQGGFDMEDSYGTQCLLELLDSDKLLDLDAMRHKLEGLSSQSELVGLAITCRGIWRGVFLPGECETCADGSQLAQRLGYYTGEDEACDALSVHALAMNSFMHGDFEEAYKLLLGIVGDLSSTCISHALVFMDYMACSLILGIAPLKADFSTFRETSAFLCSLGLTRVSELNRALVYAGFILSGGAGNGDAFNSVIHRAERMGDKLLHAFLLLVSGVADMRNGAYVRAHVRIAQARPVFDALKLEAFEKEAHLLDIAIRLTLRESVTNPELHACRGSSQSLNHVVSVMLEVCSTSHRNKRIGTGRWGNGGCPRDVLWLVSVLSKDCGTISKRFRAVMPETWLRSVNKSGAEMDACFSQIASALPAIERSHKATKARNALVADRPTTGVAAHLVYVSMLGEFKLSARGADIPIARIARRRGSNLLALLAAKRGHVMQRFEAMESVWPEHDFDTSKRCIYAATSVLRTEVLDVLEGVEDIKVVINSKCDGTIALNTAVVTCDVDIFEKRASELFRTEGNDKDVVDICREIATIYKGDLYLAPMDGSKILTVRQKELRDKFVDCMVMGTKAALRIRSYALACRFAQRAINADAMREDAIEANVRSLCAAGRREDAKKSYEIYAAKVVKTKHQPPSRSFRVTMSEILWNEESKARSRREGLAGDEFAFAMELVGASQGETGAEKA